MSGSSMVLASAASELFPAGELRQLVFDVCEFLLESQYVASPFWPGRLWRAIRGTGMGLRHSSSLADAALLVRERAALGRLASSLGVEHYWRFRDDLLLVVGCREKSLVWYREFQQCVGDIFESEIVDISCSEVDMLSLSVRAEGCRLLTSPRMKALAPPLGLSSGHPRHVLHAWPSTVLQSMARVSSDTPRLVCAMNRFIERFEVSHFPQAFVLHLRRVASTVARGRARIISSKQKATASSLWLVLPHHPLWASARLSGIVRRVQDSPEWKALAGQAWGRRIVPSIRVAWACSLPKHVHRVQRI